MAETIDSEIKHQKTTMLSKAFSDLAWSNDKEIGQNEIIYFLNKKSKDGKFDNTLLYELFQHIGIEEDTKITVGGFVNLYIQFEEELNQNISELKKKTIDEQNLYNSYQEQCYKYKNEKLNSDGFSETAKLSMEITDIEIKKPLKNIKEIILYLMYNSDKKELKFNYSPNITNFNEQNFEFKSTSKKDNFDLVLQGIEDNESNTIINIGKKNLPLEEITSQEEYSVQITIPEINKKDQIAALINCKITLHWSDYQFFEDKKKNCEIKLRKLNEASLKVNKYLLLIRQVFGLSLKNYNTEQTQATKINDFQYDSNYPNNESFSSKAKLPQELSPNPIEENNIYENKEKKNNDNQFGIGYEEAMSGYDNKINVNTKNRNRNSYKNLQAVWLIKLLSLLCILFGLFNSLQRADYSSALVGIICFYYIYFVDKNNLAVKSKNFWNLFLLIFGALIFDCLWLYINVDFLKPLKLTGGPYDNAIKKLSYFTSGCSGIIKCCLAILMFGQYRLNY